MKDHLGVCCPIQDAHVHFESTWLSVCIAAKMAVLCCQHFYHPSPGSCTAQSCDFFPCSATRVGQVKILFPMLHYRPQGSLWSLVSAHCRRKNTLVHIVYNAVTIVIVDLHSFYCTCSQSSALLSLTMARGWSFT